MKRLKLIAMVSVISLGLAGCTQENVEQFSPLIEIAGRAIKSDEFTSFVNSIDLDHLKGVLQDAGEQLVPIIQQKAKVVATNNNPREIEVIRLKYRDSMTETQLNEILNMAYVVGYVEENASFLPEGTAEYIIETFVPSIDTVIKTRASQFNSDVELERFTKEILSVVRDFDYTDKRSDHSHDDDDYSYHD